jgi:hypothetical protein
MRVDDDCCLVVELQGTLGLYHVFFLNKATTKLKSMYLGLGI